MLSQIITDELWAPEELLSETNQQKQQSFTSQDPPLVDSLCNMSQKVTVAAKVDAT